MTGIKAALSNIIKPSATATNTAKELGLQFDVAALQSKGLAGFLQDVKDKTGGNIETMGKLFGSTEALNTILSLTSSEGTEVFNAALKEMGGELNLVDEAFEGMTESSGAQFAMAINSLKISLMELGDVMAPVVQFLAEKIQGLADWFSTLDDGTKDNIVTFGLLAAAIGPVLMIIGQLIIVGGNLVTLLGATSGASGVLASAFAVLSGPIGIALLVTALVGLMSAIGNSESSIYSLQEKFGAFGVVIGGVCEYISGLVQLTFGNMIIIIEGAMNAIAAMIDGPGGLTVTDAWDNMNAKLLMNTEEAQAKLQLTTTQGMSQLRSMTESELNQLVDTTDLLMNQISVIAEGNYSEASNAIATQLQGMSTNQLTALTGMNDTTKHLFQGINTSMTVEAMAAQVAKNMQQMNNAGSLEVSDLEKDVSSAMDLIKTNINKATSEAASKANTNTKDLADKVENNTKLASSRVDLTTKQLLSNVDTNTKSAGDKVDANTKGLTNSVDNNTKDASSKVETNMKGMSSKADSASKEMNSKVTSNINSMKNNVVKTTSSMASSAISDWSRLRNEFSRSITGKINVTRTTTNVVQSQQAQAYANEAMALSTIDTSPYITRGSYFNSNNGMSSVVKSNGLNESAKSNFNNAGDTIEIKLAIDNVTVRNDDDYKTMAKKIVNNVNIELQNLKNTKNKMKGSKIYA